MKYREGTNDATDVLEDVKEYENLVIKPGDTVLDIGGHIGMFAIHAYDRGARRVVSVEPDYDNWNTHCHNLSPVRQHILIRAAVVGDDDITRDLYVNPGRNKARHTLLMTQGYGRVSVPAVSFDALIDFVMPTVLKVDCEGAEYEFDWNLPDYVRSLAIEFHELADSAYSANSDRIWMQLVDQGFVQTYVTPKDQSFRLFTFERKT